MSQSVSRLVAVLALAAAAVGALIVTGRVPSLSSGEGGGASAQQLLDQAFGHNQNVKSGRFRASLDLQLKGAATAQISGPVEMKMNGAFQEGRKAGKPKLALDASLDAAGQAVRFGVVATGEQAFVRFGRQYYEVPKSQLGRFYSQSTQSSGGQALAVLGVDPRAWLKEPTDEGAATVNGVETRHLSASVDTDRMIDDVVALAGRAQPQAASQLPADTTRQVKDAIKDARLDLYAGTDGILRKLTVHAAVESSDGGGELDFAMEFRDVNKAQRIVVPRSARPFSQLENDAKLGRLAALGSGGGSATGAGAPPSGADAAAGSATGQASALPGEAQSYLGCVWRAASEEALQRCAALLP